MNAAFPTKADLTRAIEAAARKAIEELFAQYPHHHFYYLSLITSGEVHAPALVASSKEALEEAVKDADDQDARWGLKWSYADSPFFCFGEAHFEEVNELFRQRPDPGLQDDEDYRDSAAEAEHNLRLEAMESAIHNLDQQGLFAAGDRRLKIVVNVEVMPPDRTNTERAKRLNPPEAIRQWLEEAAEPE